MTCQYNQYVIIYRKSRYPIVLGKCVAGSDYDTVDARRETSGTNSGQIPYKDNVNYSL